MTSVLQKKLRLSTAEKLVFKLVSPIFLFLQCADAYAPKSTNSRSKATWASYYTLLTSEPSKAARGQALACSVSLLSHAIYSMQSVWGGELSHSPWTHFAHC